MASGCYCDHDISLVLELTVEEASALFADVPTTRSRLQVLSNAGLGYLQLGQPATTLSGGSRSAWYSGTLAQ